MKQLLFRLVVALLLVGQAAAWWRPQLPKLPCPSSPSFTHPCVPGAMRHHRPCGHSYLQPLAASSEQGGDSSTSLGEGGGGVQPRPNEVPDAIMSQIVQEYRGREGRLETLIKESKTEIKAEQEEMRALLKDIKAGQEKMGDGLEKKVEAGQQEIKALLKEVKTDLKTGQEELKTDIKALEKSLQSTID